MLLEVCNLLQIISTAKMEVKDPKLLLTSQFQLKALMESHLIIWPCCLKVPELLTLLAKIQTMA